MQDVTRSLLAGHDVNGCEEADVKRREQMLDDALNETFPASDPVSLILAESHQARVK